MLGTDIPILPCGNGAKKVSEPNERKVHRLTEPPPATGGASGGGGGYNDLNVRLARLETEFKEVVKKTDLQKTKHDLENVIRDEVAKARHETAIFYLRILGLLAVGATLIFTMLIYFSGAGAS